MTDKWDDQADVVVVGFGGAGGAAAVAAADLGASVVIVEKQPEDDHTPSTGMTPPSIIVRVNDVDGATKYFDRCAGGLIPIAVSRAWAERAIDVLDWLSEACAFSYERQWEPHAQNPFEGGESIEVYRATQQEIAQGGLMGSLRRAVARRGIKVLWQSPGHRLIKENGRVVGVEVSQQAGGTRRIGATKGVILTCGGFEFDEDMKANYLKAFPTHFYGNPGNTGDGIRMAQAVGADLWHMNLTFGRAIAHFELDDGTPANFLVQLDPANANRFGIDQSEADSAGYVITDKFGRRFADENEQVDTIQHLFHFELFPYDVPARDYARIPCYWFFDQRRMNAGPVVNTRNGSGGLVYSWSPDSEKEIARRWIKRADSIAELAAAAGMPDPDVAATSIAAYNEGCASGTDAWGRSKESLIPLDRPPFYCMPLYPGGPATAGGPRRNEHAQILDPFGEAIPGLFAAGELGEPLGLLYPHHGCNLSECVCFGQIAAEAAVSGVPH